MKERKGRSHQQIKIKMNLLLFGYLIIYLRMNKCYIYLAVGERSPDDRVVRKLGQQPKGLCQELRLGAKGGDGFHELRRHWAGVEVGVAANEVGDAPQQGGRLAPEGGIHIGRQYLCNLRNINEELVCNAAGRY